MASTNHLEASHHVLTSLAAFQFAACWWGVQAEEVEDAEAMAEEGLASAGKGPKPPAAGGAAGQPLLHCKVYIYIYIYHLYVCVYLYSVCFIVVYNVYTNTCI